MRGRRKFEPLAIWGVVVTVLLHGGTIGGILYHQQALAAKQQAAPPDVNFVVARLVRKGKPRDPRKLPDKYVPPTPMKKADAIDPGASPDGPAAQKKKRDLRDARIANKMNNALSKAELLAQAQRQIEQEGDPNGVAHGTAKSARDGDAYITQIADKWNRTWSLPAIIPQDEARTLHVLLVLKLDKEGTIQFPLTFTRRSGNAHFDNSIIAAWKQIARLPLPTDDRLGSVLAHGLKLKLNWKGLQ